MLQVIIAMIYAFLVSIIQGKYAKNIEKSSSLEDAINARKKYYVVRYVSIGILIISGFLIASITQIVKYGVFYIDDILIFTVSFTVLVFGTTIAFSDKNVFNPISLLTINNIRKRKMPFSLFLRGFVRDDYSSAHDTQIYGYSFSENTLANAFSRLTPLFAVGMTKELVAPNGAKRIYLSDDTWQDDVYYLMRRAKIIYILINGSDNCIWEIEQSLKMPEKTCFIVDDIEQYEIAKRKIGCNNNLPDLCKSQEKLPLAFTLQYPSAKADAVSNKDNMFIRIIPIINNKKGYSKLVKQMRKIKKSS